MLSKKGGSILSERNQLVVYQFIQKYCKTFDLRWLLRKFNLPPNAYYNYMKNRKSTYHARKAEIQRRIVQIYHDVNGAPGYRMMRDLFVQRKYIYSSPTIHKYMKELGLRFITRRKKPVYRKGKGTVRYNCTIIDLFERSVIASFNGVHITSELAIETAKLAIHCYKPNKGLILHSVQGIQVNSHHFNVFFEKAHIQQSMSLVGCPYDNTPMERYYNTLKSERMNHFSYKTNAD